MSKPAVRFEDFVLHFDTSPRGGFRARVLKSPFGEGVAGFSLSSLAEAEAAFNAPGVFRHVSSGDEAPAGGTGSPLGVGTELFRTVFQGQVRTLLDKSLGQLEISPSLGLRLKIKIDPSDEETGALADLPWELLCDGETEDFFALSRQTSLVRYLDVPRSSQPIPFTPPLRVLAVAASPRGLDPLDLAEEARRLQDLNQSSSGAVHVRFLPNASAGAVREALSADAFNVLHFMGHGTFDPASGEGMLAFEAADGSADLVSGKAFATKLRDLRSLGVVVLNACDTARARHAGGANPFRGVATALVLGGVPAVVAMQRPISDVAAIHFSTALYRNLARGVSIDEALTEGRQAIHSAKPDDFEWATPVLFLRMPDGHVFVAKPADRPEVPVLPAPVPMAPPIVHPASGIPAAPRRGWMLKAAGAGGAALLVFGIYTQYTKGMAPASSSNNPAPTEVTPAQKPSPPDQKLGGGGGGATRTPLGTGNERRSGGQRNPIVHESTPPAPEPSPVSPKGPEAVEPVARLADLSNLSVQVVSITRRSEGGLQVTVSFHNSSDLPLSAVLDMESPALSDNQGQRYLIMDSDLPSAGDNLRLDLAAGASARHTFNFPAPKVGSSQFWLALATQDGKRLSKMSDPIKLEGSP